MLALLEFERRLQSLRDDRSRLVQTLRTAAHGIREQGQPPGLETIDELQFYRQRYIDLQQALVPHQEVNTDQLPTFTQFEQQRQRLVEVDTLSTKVLRANQLEHSDPLQKNLLDAVRESVAVLLDKLRDNSKCAEVVSFEQGTHPLAMLLRMCESIDSLSDDDWNVYEQRIGEEWGRSVAVAAVRGRINFKSTH